MLKRGNFILTRIVNATKWASMTSIRISFENYTYMNYDKYEFCFFNFRKFRKVIQKDKIIGLKSLNRRFKLQIRIFSSNFWND